MIFVTTGTQEPFDRLIQAVDIIASEFPDIEFIVQAFNSSYEPQNFKSQKFLASKDFFSYLRSAELIISHAGMGTIISALVEQKPILVMPRLIQYNEHRTGHQLATATKLDELGYVHVAYDEKQLIQMIQEKGLSGFKPLHQLGKEASRGLLDSLDDFIKD